jgi:hypothetical protein
LSRSLVRFALLWAGVLAGIPATASASTGQLALFQDDRELLQRGPAVRDATLDELKALGVDAIKFQLDWNATAPGDATRPPGFDGRDPSQYDWSPYDGLVSAAQARGFAVLIALSPPAPGWATARRGDRFGVDRPSPLWFGRFAEAAGKRFGNVDIWAIANEPNHPRFLYPQATRGRVPLAPHLYRGLVRAAVAGLRASGNGGDRILFGELLPIGKRRIFRNNTIKPLLFLREFFCLDRHWRPFRGGAAARRGCSGFQRITGVNGFGYHPYTRPNGPRGREPTRDDATIRSIRRITRALDIARRRGRIGGGRLSVWDTEFGFQSNPPDPFQTPISRIPAFLSESEWISYRNPRLASYSQYTLVDTPVARRGDLFGTWQGGLRFADGRVKPGVYEAYRLPLFVRLLGPGAVEIWGDARPGGGGASVQLQERSGRGAWSNLGGAFTVANARGYFRRRVRISGASRRSFRFQSGGFTSRTARAVFR